MQSLPFHKKISHPSYEKRTGKLLFIHFHKKGPTEGSDLLTNYLTSNSINIYFLYSCNIALSAIGNQGESIFSLLLHLVSLSRLSRSKNIKRFAKESFGDNRINLINLKCM